MYKIYNIFIVYFPSLSLTLAIDKYILYIDAYKKDSRGRGGKLIWINYIQYLRLLRY